MSFICRELESEFPGFHMFFLMQFLQGNVKKQETCVTQSRASNKGWEIHNGRTESCFQTNKKSITTLCPRVVLHILTPVVEGKPAPPRYERISAKFLPHLVIGDSLSHDFGTQKFHSQPSF